MVIKNIDKNKVVIDRNPPEASLDKFLFGRITVLMIENNRNCEGKITFNTVIRQHWFLKSTICSHTANS